ncbi:hypothetical protein Tco_1485589 [Tanacetum coccineum]
MDPVYAAQTFLATQDPSKDSCFISHGDQCISIASHSELDDIEKVALCFSLRLLKTKFLCIILVVLPEHPSDTKVLTMKMEILLEPTSNKLLVVGFNSLVHSLRALSTLRRSGLRTASAAAKPCQGDSSEFYLITGRIPDGSSCWQETCQFTTPCSHLIFLIKDIMITERPTTQLPQL